MFHRDKQYVVANGEVKIVDEFTGRIMEGRRYSEGLHQAIEAKEGVLVREENADPGDHHPAELLPPVREALRHDRYRPTEDAEFREIYKLARPGHPAQPPRGAQGPRRPRLPHHRRKFNAVADDVDARHAKGQPVLVGTASPSRTPSGCRACSTSAASTTRS